MKQITLYNDSGAVVTGRRRCAATLLAIWLGYGWAMAALWGALPRTTGLEVGLWLIALFLGAGLAQITLETR